MFAPNYDELPYESVPIPYTAPFAVAWNAAFQAGIEAPRGPVRVLEVGCGDGTNLVPLAFFDPDSTFVGLDVSARAIDAARAKVSALALRNVRFERADLASYAPAEFDHVIVHGVYSWIDEERRIALRSLIERALAPNGVAVVSFNAQPGWGVRGRIRDVLRGSESIADARERLTELRDALGDPSSPWAALLGRELDRAAAASDGYLAHEYLAPDNAAFWLGQVVSAFAQHGLHYVADALADRAEGHVDRRLRARVETWSGDRIAQEERIDLLGYRQLRAAIFARRPPGRGGELRGAWVASAARALGDPFDPTPGVEERFAGMRGQEFGVSEARTKIALLILASTYPRGHRVDDLRVRSETLLAEHGVHAPEDEFDAALAELHRAGELEARAIDPPLALDRSDGSQALALTRFEAAHGSTVTTPLHTALPLTEHERAQVCELDRTRTDADALWTKLARWGLLR